MTYIFKKPARPVDRVFLHCSASERPEHDSAAVIDAWHKQNGWAGIGYHFFIRKDGTLEIGRDLEKTPAAQGGNNVRTIAICLHGLDRSGFTAAQFATLRELCGQINRAYRVLINGGTRPGVTFHGHCEVAAKACPVFDYRAVLGLDGRGVMPQMLELAIPVTIPIPAPVEVDSGIEVLARSDLSVMKRGSAGDVVKLLQRRLTNLGYFTGRVDGDFGPRTEAAVLAFQADNNLETDGRFGPLTREAMADASPRAVAPERAVMSLMGLSAEGSRIATASIRNIAVGAVLGTGGLAAVIEDVTGQADVIQTLFAEHGLITGGVILAAGAFVARQSWRAGQARVEDHRTGKTA